MVDHPALKTFGEASYSTSLRTADFLKQNSVKPNAQNVKIHEHFLADLRVKLSLAKWLEQYSARRSCQSDFGAVGLTGLLGADFMQADKVWEKDIPVWLVALKM